MKVLRNTRNPRHHSRRLGAATLDYILMLAIIFPLAAVVIPLGKLVIQLTYEMVCVFIAWPFL